MVTTQPLITIDKSHVVPQIQLNTYAVKAQIGLQITRHEPFDFFGTCINLFNAKGSAERDVITLTHTLI